MALKIAVVVGSLRRDSFNKQLAHALVSLAPSDFSFEFLDIGTLPLYSQDYDSDFPEVARAFKQKIADANGLLIVTPEYNRSIPGVLKNAIDHASRPYGQSAWGGKPAGVLGISIGQIGTAIAQQHLRTVLAYLDMPTLGQPEVFLTAKDGFFEASGEIANDGTRQFLQGWMDKYAAFVKHHATAAAHA
jgi:chromate reductase